MTADELCDLLEGSASQRTKLAAIRAQHLPAIAALSDDDHRRVVREIKKRLNSPKLVDDVAALVRELAREYAPAPPKPEPGPPPAGADGDALRAAIEADPDNHETYAVYGDWLQSRGDPRGELIAIGAELAKNPDHAKIKAAHKAHLGAHGAAILGPLASYLDVLHELEWRFGFIRTCRISYPLERFNLERPAVAMQDVVRWLVDEPGAGRFLQHLVVGMIRHDDNVYQPVVDALAARPRPTLRTLYIGDFEREECELNWARLGELSALWPAVPNLRELTLRGGAMAVGPIDLPRLQKLTTITGGLDVTSLGHLARADWPSLTHLHLMVGPRTENAATSADVLAPLLAGTRVPKLTSLAIANSEFTDRLCELLVDSPLLPQLTALDLSMGTMTAAGAQVLATNRARFEHLRLNVENNFLGAEASGMLGAAFPGVLIGDQRDDRGDPGRRYAMMYE